MERRIAFSLVAAVALAALTGSRIGMAAEPPAAGTITTVAGIGGPAGFAGDGGPATQARLNSPAGVAVGAAGAFFIGEHMSGRVRKVSPDGMISTVAARLSNPILVALDQAGNLFINERGANRVRKLSPAGLLTTVAGTGTAGFSGDGGPATKARIVGQGGLAVDAAGNLFLADHNNHRIRKVSPDGIITTVAGSGPTSRTGVSTGDGGLATEARLNGPFGLALDRSGNLFFSEAGYDAGHIGGGYRVRKLSAAGIISTVAGSDAPGFSGDGGPATQARLNTPLGVAVDTEGNLFIADNDRIRKVDGSGMISTVAGNGTNRYAGDGVPATATGLVWPVGLAVDAVGNLLIADHEGHRVLKLFGVAAPGLLAGEPFPVSEPQ